MDIWSKRKRSLVMSKILSCDTIPEKQVRRVLSDMGYHYRLNVKTLPGKPDIVIHKYRVVIFIHGCFWHLHSNCRDGTIPKTRTDYWRTKLVQNRQRDIKCKNDLRKMGWKVLCLWECDIEKRPNKVIKRIKEILN